MHTKVSPIPSSNGALPKILVCSPPLARFNRKAHTEIYMHTEIYIRRRKMKILMVLTSHDVLGNTGRKTGFWLEEFAAPYFVFRDADVQLTPPSPKGGQPPLDPKS